MRFFFFFLNSFFFISNLFSEAVLSDYSGSVKFRKNSFSDWETVSAKNIVLPDGSALKTENNSKAKIILDESTIWLKPDSALEIETTSKYYTSFGLVYGKIKASVVGLVKKARFQVRTVSAVFGVRGTDIMVNSSIDGRCSIDVLFGEVEFEYLIPPKKGKRSFMITQGMSFEIQDVEKPYTVSLINKERENEILSNWDPSVSEEKSYENVFKMEDRKERLKNFIAYSNAVNSEISKFVYKEKESDFESGRSLKDIHGNIVRVDQRLMRPDPKTLELFNLVKRAEYKNYSYASSYSYMEPGFKYNGGGVNNRLDAFIITFSFNKDIPKDINKWQSFFSDSSVNPDWATFVNANITDKSNVFFTAEAYKYNGSRGELINNTEVVGVSQNSNDRDKDVLITGVIDKTLLDDIVKMNFMESNFTNPTGNLVKKSDSSQIFGALWGVKIGGFEFSGTDKIYQLKGTKYVKGANFQTSNNDDYFWLTQENYLISNSGRVRSKEDIFSSNKSVSEIINSNAIQSISYVKKNLSNTNGVSDDDYFSSSNIDSVIIGDVPFMMLEKVSGGVDRWKY